MRRVAQPKPALETFSHSGTWLAWLRCYVCNTEFRREPYYSVFVRTQGPIVEVCRLCASSTQEAAQKVYDKIHLKRPPNRSQETGHDHRPPPPKPPPNYLMKEGSSKKTPVPLP